MVASRLPDVKRVSNVEAVEESGRERGGGEGEEAGKSCRNRSRRSPATAGGLAVAVKTNQNEFRHHRTIRDLTSQPMA